MPRFPRREWLAHLAGVSKITRPEWIEPPYEFDGEHHMPRPTHFPDYVFRQFPEVVTLPDSSQVTVNSQEEKDAALEAATSPDADEEGCDTVREFRRGPGRPKKIG